MNISEHRKADVDHTDKLAKTAIRQVVEKGGFFQNAGNVVKLLASKFSKKADPVYYIKEIMQKDLESQGEASKQQEFESIKGISSFKVILFSLD